MGQRIDEQELRRRAIAGIRDEVEAFGSAARDSRLIRREGADFGFIEMWELRS